MYLDAQRPRRVRIVGKPDDVTGYRLEVRDAETDEVIEHVFEAELHLSAYSDNWVTLTYYLSNESGHLLAGADGETLEETVRLPYPEVDLTAYMDRHPWLKKLPPKS